MQTPAVPPFPFVENQGQTGDMFAFKGGAMCSSALGCCHHLALGSEKVFCLALLSDLATVIYIEIFYHLGSEQWSLPQLRGLLPLKQHIPALGMGERKAELAGRPFHEHKQNCCLLNGPLCLLSPVAKVRAKLRKSPEIEPCYKGNLVSLINSASSAILTFLVLPGENELGGKWGLEVFQGRLNSAPNQISWRLRSH